MPSSHFTTLDWCVLLLYFAAVIGLGCYFHRRNRSAEDFTAGGRAISGWLCGLSIFATFLSSISYLALPGKSFVDNWNAFVFSLALPPAALLASRWFVPHYRRTGEVSAYALLERRFGTWARLFASGFYLLYQIARMGVVMYLMALPLTVIFGWDIRLVIGLTGLTVTIYAFIGGIVAVIWADAIQAVVLVIGALIALGVIVAGIPDGLGGVIRMATAEDKFSLGSWQPGNISEPTVWVIFAFGIAENIKNFGIDQSYIQRYIAADSQRAARRSVWLAAGLYIPISGLFFLIGTALYAYYQTHESELREVQTLAARQSLLRSGVVPEFTAAGQWTAAYRQEIDTHIEQLAPAQVGDRVFPHFIAAHLPAGVTGLLIAAIFAAAMSTVSTSLNSSATLVMSDFYQRLFNRDADDRAQMRCLHSATVVWGIFGTGMAFMLVRLTDSVLDIWWTLSSALGAGIVGLFLLGIVSRRATSRDALRAVAVGMLVIGWMLLSNSPLWPTTWNAWQSPFDSRLVIVVGTLTILLVGALQIGPRRSSDHRENGTNEPPQKNTHSP
jgi:SSS family solute:Na+ symporter